MAASTAAALCNFTTAPACCAASNSSTSPPSGTSLARPLCHALSSSFRNGCAALRLQAKKVQVSNAGLGEPVEARAAVTVEPPKQRKKSQYEIQTFTGWLLRQEQAGVIDGELTIVLNSIAVACKQIASLVQRAGISNLTGVQGAVNVQGEDQKKLDVISNEVFSNCLRSSGRTGIIASEEEDTPVAVEESYSGNYVVVFDPLDGSSNIDAAVSTGSIFGIYRPTEECLADLDDETQVKFQN